MQQTNTKGVRDLEQLGQKFDPLGIVQDMETWAFYPMVYE